MFLSALLHMLGLQGNILKRFTWLSRGEKAGLAGFGSGSARAFRQMEVWNLKSGLIGTVFSLRDHRLMCLRPCLDKGHGLGFRV